MERTPNRITLPAVGRRWAVATVGLSAGFSGLAVISTILTGVPLIVAEIALVALPLGATVFVIRRAPGAVVREVWRVVRAGLLAGFGATLVYDVTRTVLSVADPSPYNPFEAVRRFGLGVLPSDAPTAVLLTAGMGVHLLNGTSFGVIYATFSGRIAASRRGAVLSGIAWGLTLEFVQSILYPGWLNITTVLREFLLISGLGHVAFGATLGIGVHWALWRTPQQMKGRPSA